MNILVGKTGFVGSNLYENGNFDAAFHSVNIKDAYGVKPDLLVYAGLRAEKYLANQDPERDMGLIRQAEENISRIEPKRLVLISTIDVFRKPYLVDECSEINTESLQAYGGNRYKLEQWVETRFSDALIIRLPGLFGKNIKKNFIYDYIRRIPSMLRYDKMQELAEKEAELPGYYELRENGFYQCRKLDRRQEKELKVILGRTGFSALNFTDSRSTYQFYPLKRLWADIQTALENNLRIWHPAVEPVSAGELYEYLSGKTWRNELPGSPAEYDYRTAYAELFGGKNGYIMDKQCVLEEIKQFVDHYEG